MFMSSDSLKTASYCACSASVKKPSAFTIDELAVSSKHKKARGFTCEGNKGDNSILRAASEMVLQFFLIIEGA